MVSVSASEEDSEIVHSIRHEASKTKPPECFRRVDQPAKKAQEGTGAVAWRGRHGLEVPVWARERNAS